MQRGKTWSYVVRVRDPNTGKMKDQWKGGFKTKTTPKGRATTPVVGQQGYGGGGNESHGA